MNPSTAQILEAVEQTPSKSVIVLPNNKNIVPVAHQVDGLTAHDVAVVPTNTVVQALAALVSYDPDATLDANVSAMSEAAARVRTGEITRAVARALRSAARSPRGTGSPSRPKASGRSSTRQPPPRSRCATS